MMADVGYVFAAVVFVLMFGVLAFVFQRDENEKLRSRVAQRDENEKLRSRVAELLLNGDQVAAERDRWEAEAKRLQEELNLAPRKSPSAAGDRRFAQAKREFARLYHPNGLTGSSFERTVRGEIFKEFWEVLQRIENT
jgi:hypothetical protein